MGLSKENSLRVAIVGYGAVASIHARQLPFAPGAQVSVVFGPNSAKAAAFASIYHIPHFTDSLTEALARADAAIVSSPSEFHFQQAHECLQSGIHTLIELPACKSSAEIEELGWLARKHRILVRCAHTSRYLAPYSLIRESLRNGEVGRIHQVEYLRHPILRERSWTDDALLHHAAHPLDLLMEWFGDVTPRACVAVPGLGQAQSVSLLGQLPNGAPAALSVSYASRLPHSRMILVGDHQTLETDGFSHLRSDTGDLRFTGQVQSVYEEAIRLQDASFLAACKGEPAGIPWEETSRLVRLIEQFRGLGNSSS